MYNELKRDTYPNKNYSLWVSILFQFKGDDC